VEPVIALGSPVKRHDLKMASNLGLNINDLTEYLAIPDSYQRFP
jgi:hypothetical protein